MTTAENQYLDTLTDDFFIEIVAKKLAIDPSAFRVRIVYITSACAVGENFVAKIFRARVQLCMVADGAQQTVSVILKVHLNPVQAIKEFQVFPREIKVYGHILPTFERIYREAGVEVTFGPACLKCETEPYEVIVLNDLNADGYRVIERLTSLDADHLFVVLKKLAQFHAVSMIYHEKVRKS
jgi:Ecdysteroid kinase-like family